MERTVNKYRVPPNKETLSWFTDNLENRKATEEKFKRKDLSFFKLSPEMGAKVKRSFTREVKHFADMHQNLLRKWLRDFLKENGGLPIVYSSSATPDGLLLKKRTFFQPRLWATTDEYHFTHEYL